MENYAAIRKDKIMQFAAKMNETGKYIIVSKVTQKENIKYKIISFFYAI